MNVKIFTLHFDKEMMDFNSNELNDFCANKKIISQKSQFFQVDNRPFWTVSVEYEDVVKFDKLEDNLDKVQKELFERLRIWRKNAAMQAGIPPYIIATNKQFAEIILRKITTKARLNDISGFGTKKVANYGNQIIEITSKFYKNGIH